MATTLNAGTTTATGLNVTTDTTGAMVIQTSGVNAISISTSQIVTLANALPAGSGGTGLTSLGTGVATFLGTPSSANLAAAVTGETGTGALVFGTSPTLNTATLDSPTLTGTPVAPTATAGTNTTQIATTAFVLANGAPTGGLIMWSTGTAPSGWLLCNGTAVSRSTYAALFAVIGTTFGAGDTTTTFNLPNYTNRFPYGTSIGTTGGSANAVVVSHTHSITDPGHLHTYDPRGTIAVGPGSYAPVAYSTSSANTSTATTGITVDTAGVSGTNANIPPYLGINFIIKT